MHPLFSQNGAAPKRLLWRQKDPSKMGGSAESQKESPGEDLQSKEVAIPLLQGKQRQELLGQLGETLSPKVIAENMKKLLYTEDQDWILQTYGALYPELTELPISKEDRREIIAAEHERLDELIEEHAEKLQEQIERVQKPLYSQALQAILGGSFADVDPQTRELVGKLGLTDSSAQDLMNLQLEKKAIGEEIKAEQTRLVEGRRALEQRKLQRSQEIVKLRDKWQETIPDTMKWGLRKGIKFTMMGAGVAAAAGLAAGFVGLTGGLGAGAASMSGYLGSFFSGLSAKVVSGLGVAKMTTGGTLGMLGLGAATNRIAVRPVLVKARAVQYDRGTKKMEADLNAEAASQRIQELRERDSAIDEEMESKREILRERIQLLKERLKSTNTEMSRLKSLLPQEALNAVELPDELEATHDHYEQFFAQKMSLQTVIESLEGILNGKKLHASMKTVDDYSQAINKESQHQELEKIRQDFYEQVEAQMQEPFKSIVENTDRGGKAFEDAATDIDKESLMKSVLQYFDPKTKKPKISEQELKDLKRKKSTQKIAELIEDMQSLHPRSSLHQELRQEMHPILEAARRALPLERVKSLCEELNEGELEGVIDDTFILFNTLQSYGLSSVPRPRGQESIDYKKWLSNLDSDELFDTVRILNNLLTEQKRKKKAEEEKEKKKEGKDDAEKKDKKTPKEDKEKESKETRKQEKKEREDREETEKKTKKPERGEKSDSLQTDGTSKTSDDIGELKDRIASLEKGQENISEEIQKLPRSYPSSGEDIDTAALSSIQYLMRMSSDISDMQSKIDEVVRTASKFTKALKESNPRPDQLKKAEDTLSYWKGQAEKVKQYHSEIMKALSYLPDERFNQIAKDLRSE